MIIEVRRLNRYMANGERVAVMVTSNGGYTLAAFRLSLADAEELHKKLGDAIEVGKINTSVREG